MLVNVEHQAKAMKVLLVHQQGSAQGSGAVIAMYQLHRALQRAGIESTVACKRKSVDGDDFVLLPSADRLERILGMVTWRLGLNDIHCVSSYKLPRLKQFQEADVVNIHGWHSNFFSYMALPKICRQKPVVATFHDMWNFTGHCAYSLDCDRWKHGCGKCPDLGIYPAVPRDSTALVYKLKNRAYRRSSMSIVTGSQWLRDQVEQSMLSRFPVHLIHYGVDTEVYRPIDQDLARAALEIAPDRHVILFAAMALSSPFKGGDLLIEAMRNLSPAVREKTVLLLMGDRGEAIAKAADLPAVPLGYVVSDRLKALAYSAADVFVIPSRAEVQGIVMLESMACATPVAGFRVGGIPEPIEPGVNGELAEPENPMSLRDAIERILVNEDHRHSLGQAARKTIIERYHIDHYVRDYLDLFRSVIEARSKPHSPDNA